jgi:hypothetical protein
MELLEALWSKHGIVLMFVVWPVVSMVLNGVLRKKTPEQWVEFANKSPRLAGILKLISATGFDPVMAIKALQQTVKGASDQAHTANPKAAAVIDVLAGTPEPKSEEKSK